MCAYIHTSALLDQYLVISLIKFELVYDSHYFFLHLTDMGVTRVGANQSSSNGITDSLVRRHKVEKRAITKTVKVWSTILVDNEPLDPRQGAKVNGKESSPQPGYDFL